MHPCNEGAVFVNGNWVNQTANDLDGLGECGDFIVVDSTSSFWNNNVSDFDFHNGLLS